MLTSHISCTNQIVRSASGIDSVHSEKVVASDRGFGVQVFHIQWSILGQSSHCFLCDVTKRKKHAGFK